MMKQARLFHGFLISTLTLAVTLGLAIATGYPTPPTGAAALPTETINFDGPAYPSGTRITNQYAGVIFPTGGIITSASTLGTSTQSAPNLLRKDCRGIGGIDLGAFGIQFTASQGRVRVFVGNPSATAQQAILRGYDALTGGNLVATAEASLAANAAVTTPLEICRAANRDIRRVEIEVSGLSCEVIDDLLFDPNPVMDTIATVNFDDRAPGTQISTQYAGVIFPGAPVVRAASSLSTTTISPPNLLVQQISGVDEFDVRPLTIQFTNPQAWVRIYTGLPPLPGSPTVRLSAYSAASGGSPVAIAQVTFPDITAVNASLEVCRFEQRDIRRVEIQRIDLVAAGNTSGLEVIDNLQFAGSTTPPPPPDTEAPRVFIDSPPNNGFFFEPAEFLYPVRGRINENRALERVRVSVEQIGGTGRFELENILDISSGSVTGSAPNFSFVAQVKLFPGRNRIRVEATDTAGNRSTNAEQEVIVTLAPAVEVLIDSPRPDQVFTQRSVTVTGRVRKQLGALTRERLQIRVQPLGAPRTFVPVDAVEGAAPEFRFRATVNLIKDEAITDAVNPIEVQATLEDGRVVRATVSVIFSEPDVSISGLEITQATQTTANLTAFSGSGVPLIAFKKTVLRVYPNAARWRGGSAVTVRQITVRGSSGGLDLPGSPMVVNQPMSVVPETPNETLRRDVTRTWNVVLPNEWTQEGELRVEATINSNRTLAECERCFSLNSRSQSSLRFQAPAALRVAPVIVDGGGPRVATANIPRIFEGIRRAYPIASLTLLPPQILRTNAGGDDLLNQLGNRFTCYAAGDPVGRFFDWFEDCRWDTYVVGLVPNTAAGCPGGIAYLNSPVCWTEDSPWVAAQELAHCLGRSHAGNDHGEAGGGGFDPSFPYPHGRIGEAGFDTTAMRVIPTEGPFPSGVPTLFGPCREGADHAHDFMSYGDGPHWISPYTYEALSRSGFRGGGRFSELPIQSQAPASPPEFLTSQSGDYLFVSGKQLPNGLMNLDPSFTSKLPASARVKQGTGRFTLELQARDSRVLFSGKFDLKHSTHDDEDDKLFTVVAPLPAGVARILVKDGATVLATKEISANAPVVRLLSPNGGESWPATGRQLISWAASDPDGDPLTYTLQYSRDGGQNWQLIADQVQGASYEFDASWLPGGQQARVRIMATDGFNTVRDESDASFTVARKAPWSAIFSPEDKSVINPDQELVFEGSVSDYEDDSIPNAKLIWTSDRDGQLGVGNRIDVARLSVGVHAITLAAKDSDGMEGRASVTVLVPGPEAAHVSAASFRQTALASEMIVSVFGNELATGVAIANSLPLPTTLAGTRVTLRDRSGKEHAVPLFFVAPTQINYLMPAGLPAGAATITIINGNGKATVSPLLIDAVAPGLFAANANGQGVPAASLLRVRANGTQSYEQVAQFDQQQNQYVARPIDLGPDGDQVFLILFGTGLRQRSALSNVQALIGGANAEVLYAGPAPGFVGLDQINLRIPRSLIGRGEVEVGLRVDDRTTNLVRISIR
ncbi:MAG: hypothetical protein ABI977_03935 [Acidobacteriota bacterium]